MCTSHLIVNTLEISAASHIVCFILAWTMGIHYTDHNEHIQCTGAAQYVQVHAGAMIAGRLVGAGAQSCGPSTCKKKYGYG